MGGRAKRTIQSFPIDGKTILIRSDLDIPIVNGKVDPCELTTAAKTISYALQRRCKVIVIGHLSRPDGRDESFSLRPVAEALEVALGKPVLFLANLTGIRAQMLIKRVPPGSLVVLENLRFYKGEEANDGSFARELVITTGAKYFILDAPRAACNSAASITRLPEYLPGAVGFAMKAKNTICMKGLLDA